MSKIFVDHYAILGVSQKATKEEIRKAFMQKIKIHHPDRNPRQSANGLEMCKAINKAYSILSGFSRNMYDIEYNEHQRSQPKKNSPKTNNDRGYNQDQQNTNQQDKQKNAHHQEKPGNRYQEHRSKNDHQSSQSQKDSRKSNNDRGYNQNQQNTGQQEKQKNTQGNKERSYEQQNGKHNKENHSSNRRSGYQYNTDNRYRENYSNWGYQNREHGQRRHQGYHNSQNQNHNFSYQNSYGNHNFESSHEHTDLYDVLGVRKNASQKDIKKAFQKLLFKYDLESDSPDTHRKFSKLLRAYYILSNPDMRADYDKENGHHENHSTGYGTFHFPDGETFHTYGSTAWGVALTIIVGCGYAIYIIGKWLVIVLYNVAKFIIKTVKAYSQQE